MAFVCVYVCACVCMCKPVCTQTPTRGCGSGRSMPGVLLCDPPLFYTRQGLTEPGAHLPVCFSVPGLQDWPCLYVFLFYFYVTSGDSNSGISFLHSQELLPTEPSLQPSLMNLLPAPSPHSSKKNAFLVFWISYQFVGRSGGLDLKPVRKENRDHSCWPATKALSFT